MTPDLNSKLVEKYPKIIGKLSYTECNDGWYDLIDVLCSQIQKHIDFKIQNSQLSEEEQKSLQVVALQIKSKFGGLRFYVTGGDDTTEAMIHMAESISFRICEHCSAKGKQQSLSGWIYTSCNPCFEKRTRRIYEKSQIKE